MDGIIAFMLSQNYTNLVALGITSATVDNVNKTITFTLTADGSQHTIQFEQPTDGKDGLSIVDIQVNSDKSLNCIMSDNSIIKTNPLIIESSDIDYANTGDNSITNLKNALDKLFDEVNKGSSVLEKELVPNVKQGSVKTSYPIGTSLEEIIRDMLTEKIPPTISFMLNPSKLLYDIVNEKINSITINAIATKKTNDIEKIEYFINDVSVNTNTNVLNSGSFPYIYNNVINKTTTIKVVVTDTEGLTSVATKKIEFYPVIYYGIVDANISEPNESIIKTLNFKLQNTKEFTYSGINTDWGKVCVAIPKVLGVISTILDPINNFSYNNSFASTTVNINGYEYSVLTQIDASASNGTTLKFL